MKNDNEIVQSLIAGGVVGASLGTLLTKNIEQSTPLGTLASAAILATFKANEAAEKTSISMFFEEDGYLYQTQSGGLKQRVKKIEKPVVKLQDHFKLQ